MPKYRVQVVVTVECSAKNPDVACKSAESLVREYVERMPTPAKVEWIGCDPVTKGTSSVQ